MCDKCSHDEYEQLKFVCECGKELETQIKLSHHKTRCKVFQTNKKRRELEDKESRRLPNGMFKCENPKCGKEHDGNYGSGRFCSRHCRDQFNGITSAKTSIKNGTKHAPENFKVKPAPYGTWKCIECNLIFETRAKLSQHRHEQHKNCRHAWNKGLTKETSSITASTSIKVGNSIKNAYAKGRLTGRCKDPAKEEFRKKKISETMKKNPNAGGQREGSGRGQQGWYKGYYCDSSWELAVVIYWLDHNIRFSRCKETFDYIFKDSIHKYHPDFILETGEYVEVKGAEKTNQWKAKFEQFPTDKILNVIGKNQIGQYLSYVIEKYGKDFIKLYEKSGL